MPATATTRAPDWRHAAVHGDRRAQHAPRAAAARHAERPRFGRGRLGRRRRPRPAATRATRVERLAQPAHRQHATARHLAGRRHQDVEVARQLHVLEAVVEHVHGGAELALGEHAGQVAIRRTTTTTAPGTARASISGSSPARVDVGEHARAVGDDDRRRRRDRGGRSRG